MRIRSIVFVLLAAPAILSGTGGCAHLCRRFCPPKDGGGNPIGIKASITRPTLYTIRRNSDNALVGTVMQYVTPDGMPTKGWVIITDPLLPDGEIDEGVLFANTTLRVADDGTGLSWDGTACTLHNTPIEMPRLYDWDSTVATMNPGDHRNYWDLKNGRHGP